MGISINLGIIANGNGSYLMGVEVTYFEYELDGCIVRNAHNTVFGLKGSAICTQLQAVYFLYSTRPSVT